jgi:DAK2 domain fusion protein YloV
VKEAYAAVRDPVDGTILSVARAAAESAAGAPTLADTVTSALSAAELALLHTPEQLPVLARAGVVDAGGQGLVFILQALAEIVTGERAAAAPSSSARPSTPSGFGSAHGPEASEYGYEIQYLLDAGADVVPALRDRLAALGGSVAVVGTGGGVWNVHVHSDDIGAAIEAGTEAGRPHRISVVRLPEAGATDLDAASGRTDHGSDHPAARSGTAVVAVAPGEGLAHLFQHEGVGVVDVGIRGELPVEAVLDAVLATAAAEVVLLPNAEQAGQVSEQAARQARALGVRVTVVPTRSPVQGLAAVAVHDSTRAFDEDVVAMAESAAATRFAAVTTAESESLTTVGICQPGDVLGLIDGEVVEIGRGLVSVSFALIDRLLGVGAELMTLVVGRDAPAGVGEVLARHVTERAPLTDVTVYAGGQPRYPLIIGVE